MHRKKFFTTIGALGAGAVLGGGVRATDTAASNGEDQQGAPVADRQVWLQHLLKIAGPVLQHMSRGELAKKMQVEVSPQWDGRDKKLTYMETFGRLMAGITPWLGAQGLSGSEATSQQAMVREALQAYGHAVDPQSPDYLLWRKEGQPLVDAAFIAHSFLRAPKAMWEPLDTVTKKRYIDEFIRLRRVKPPYNNWLLFAAMVEAFLLSIGEDFDPMRIDLAIRKTNEWYVGDGWYGDGPVFHFDYYNGYVIQPMLTDILDVWTTAGKAPRKEYDLALQRMQRHAEFQERMISPEGTYPAFGRSVTYRMGLFQPLAQLAMLDKLPQGYSRGQVRSALTTVMQRQFAHPGNFDKEGWLQLGFAGHQPNIADSYSNNGSMYLTSLVFLPLGLPDTHPFWTDAPEPWTAKRAWAGEPFKKDYAVNY